MADNINLMTIPFYKYQGAGNDFIVIDERQEIFFNETPERYKLISHLCNRRFGIGADGLMLLRNHNSYDFEMVYFNSDGHEGSMCGNGGRCLVAFAAHLKLIEKSTTFIATDGMHHAEVVENKDNLHIVSLQMKDVDDVKTILNGHFLDTGSPHFVLFTRDIQKIDVFNEGRKMRNNPVFGPGGTNINFAEIAEDSSIEIRTYERGVEDETLACGTGITATAIAAYHNGFIKHTNHIKLKARGGDLTVSFQVPVQGIFQNIYLQGPAQMVFKGEIEV
jgi:diaminopimelate epimerase